MTTTRSTIRNILLFALLVNGLAWLGPVLGGSPTEPGLGLLVWGSAPLVAALIMKLGLRDPVSLGLRPRARKPGNGRFYRLSLLYYPLAIAAVLMVGWLLGAVTFSAMPVAEFLAALVPLVVIYFLFAFFEEIGWRGYLTPRVYALNDGLLGHGIVGLIWASWHLPYMNELWAHAGVSPLTLLPLFLLGTVLSAVVYGEIRLGTGSVWPAVLMHWIGNTLANGLLLTVVTLVPGRAWLGSFGVEGVGMMAIAALVGGRLYQRRQRGATHRAAPAHRNPAPPSQVADRKAQGGVQRGAQKEAQRGAQA